MLSAFALITSGGLLAKGIQQTTRKAEKIAAIKELYHSKIPSHYMSNNYVYKRTLQPNEQFSRIIIRESRKYKNDPSYISVGKSFHIPIGGDTTYTYEMIYDDLKTNCSDLNLNKIWHQSWNNNNDVKVIANYGKPEKIMKQLNVEIPIPIHSKHWKSEVYKYDVIYMYGNHSGNDNKFNAETISNDLEYLKIPIGGGGAIWYFFSFGVFLLALEFLEG